MRAGLYPSPVKVLLVTLYFPPAGGGGVQRPLKLAQYLPALGIETHVLAPDDPKWVHRDPDLRVPTQAWVHRVRYVGPKARKPAEELAATDGIERALLQARVTARRLLVPDASVTWNLTAIPAAIRIVRREGIDVVMTTSPPGSIHFVGAAVKQATGARWLADLRDPLVANQQRRADTAATRARQAANEQLARLVARRADAISCVSDAIAEEVRGLDPRGIVRTIANGCDFDDFAGLEYRPAPRFRITHAGSFFGKRDPRPFLQALHDSGVDAVARFVGDFRSSDREWAETLGLGDRLELIPYAPRLESLRLQRDSEALLLLDPERGRKREGSAVGKGLRVPRGRQADSRRRPAGRRRGRAHPRDGRRRRGRARRRRGHRRRAARAARAVPRRRRAGGRAVRGRPRAPVPPRASRGDGGLLREIVGDDATRSPSGVDLGERVLAQPVARRALPGRGRSPSRSTSSSGSSPGRSRSRTSSRPSSSSSSSGTGSSAATRGSRAPPSVALAFFLAFALVYLAGFYALDTSQALAQWAKGMVKFVLHFGFLVTGVALLARRSLAFYWLALAAFLGGIALNALYGVIQLALAELVGREPRRSS